MLQVSSPHIQVQQSSLLPRNFHTPTSRRGAPQGTICSLPRNVNTLRTTRSQINNSNTFSARPHITPTRRPRNITSSRHITRPRSSHVTRQNPCLSLHNHNYPNHDFRATRFSSRPTSFNDIYNPRLFRFNTTRARNLRQYHFLPRAHTMTFSTNHGNILILNRTAIFTTMTTMTTCRRDHRNSNMGGRMFFRNRANFPTGVTQTKPIQFLRFQGRPTRQLNSPFHRGHRTKVSITINRNNSTPIVSMRRFIRTQRLITRCQTLFRFRSHHLSNPRTRFLFSTNFHQKSRHHFTPRNRRQNIINHTSSTITITTRNSQYTIRANLLTNRSNNNFTHQDQDFKGQRIMLRHRNIKRRATRIMSPMRQCTYKFRPRNKVTQYEGSSPRRLQRITIHEHHLHHRHFSLPNRKLLTRSYQATRGFTQPTIRCNRVHQRIREPTTRSIGNLM